MGILMQGCVRLTFTIQNQYWSPWQTTGTITWQWTLSKKTFFVERISAVQSFFWLWVLFSNLFYQPDSSCDISSFFDKIICRRFTSWGRFKELHFRYWCCAGKIKLLDSRVAVKNHLCEFSLDSPPLLSQAIHKPLRSYSFLECFVLNHDASLLG